MRRTLALFLALAAVPLGSGCEDEPTVNSIVVSPSTATIKVGVTQLFQAQGVKSDGTTVTLADAEVAWESSDTTVATMNGAVATGVKAGTATITAKYKGLSGTATLTVTEGTIKSVTVTPPTATVAVGGKADFKATANYDDNTTADVTADATWAATPADVASVDKGTATGLKVGTAEITAEFKGVKSQAVTLTVKSGVKSINVTPVNPTIPKGTTQQFKAEGVFDDNTTQDITGQVTWSSDKTSVATIDAAGLAKGVAVGEATITATFGSGDAAVTGSTKLTVSEIKVNKVEVEPLAATVTLGGTVTFKATAFYDDNITKQDVTATATWKSSDTTVATIDATGTATGVKASAAPVDITATYQGVTSAPAKLVVTDAVIVSIEITPPDPKIAKGTTQQFTATATLSNQTKMNITSSASWQSSNTAVATMDAATPGLANGLAKGKVDITATQGGVTGKTTLEVTDATCASITIEPSSDQVLPLGETLAFTATCTLTDMSTQDVTTQVTWATAPTGIVAFTGAQAKAVALGNTVVTATLPGSSATSNSVKVTVSDKQLKSIAIDNPPTAPIPVGATYSFTATGTYSDGSTANVTTLVTWSSSAGTVASISNAAGTQGLATALAGGTTSITAKYGTVTSPAVTLTVQAGVTLSYIVITPESATINVGQAATFKATGYYSNGSFYDITQTVTWLAVCHTGTTPVSNFTVVAGKVTGVASTYGLDCGSAIQNYARVMAKMGSVQSFAKVTVKDSTIASIKVTCAAPTTCLPTNIGYQVKCTALATYADGSTGDVTGTASWASDATSVATAAAGGVVTMVGAGTANITANQGGKTSTAVQVQGATMTLTSLTVSPVAPTINVGFTQQFTATGTFTTTDPSCASEGDYSYSYNVTAYASWTSSNPSVATISNAPASKGLAIALSKGTTTIAPTLGTISSPGVTLTVSDACLQKVVIDQHNPTYPDKVVVPLTVKAYYSNAPQTPVQLKPEDFTSSPWDLGSCGALGYSMDATGWLLSVGTADCSAIKFTVNVGCAGPVSDTISVKADTAAAVTAFSIKPATATIVQGAAQDFIATATFGAAGSFNVSPFTSWSNSPAVTGLSHGPATAPAAELPAERFSHSGTVGGSTTVTAAYGTSVATASLTVSGKTVTKVEVTNITPAPCNGGFPVGIKLAFTAKVTYSDGSSDTNPTGLTFASNAPAKLDFAPGTNIASTLSPSGTADPTVTATFQGKTSAAYPVKIHPTSGTGAVVLTDMTFSEAQGATLDQNITKPLIITGVYGTCGTYDISALVTSASGNDTIIDVTTTSTGTTIKTFSTPTGGTPVTLSFIKDGLTRTLGLNVGTTKCLSSVAISPASTSLAKGLTADFTATATDTTGGTSDVTTLGTWTTSPAGILASEGFVAGKQRYRGLAVGSTTVTFTLTGANVCKGGQVGQTTITGNAGVTVTPATVVGVYILTDTGYPAGFGRWIPLGETAQLRAMGVMSDGSAPQDITSAPGTVWTSAFPMVVTVSGTGLVSAVGVGDANAGIIVTVNATLTASIGIRVRDCGSPTVTVAGAGGASGPLPIGQTRDHTATALYSGAGNCSGFFIEELTYDVTKVAAWSSSNTTAASVDSQGTVTAKAAGSTNLTATYKGQLSNALAINVVAVSLKSLAITPAPSTSLAVGAGGALEISVAAVWTDGANDYPLDPPVVGWAISDNTVVSITGPKAGTANKKYTLTGLKAGSTTYFAQVSTVISNTVTATVSPACITGISLTSPSSDVVLPAGAPFALQAACTTSDGSPLPCTPTFAVQNDANGIVVNYTGSYSSNGKAKVKETATAGQTAEVYATITGCAGAAKATTARKITVGTATLASITVPAALSMAKGVTKPLPATGTYANGTGAGDYNLTDLAVYTSNNPSVVTTQAPNPGGLLTSLQLDGTALVKADYMGKSSNLSTVTVSGKELVSIAISAELNLVGGPTTSAQYPAGGYTLQLKATGHYSSGPDDDITSEVSWSLNTPVVTGTTITASGLLTTGSPAAQATQVVKASLGAVSSTFNVTIVPGAVTTIAIKHPAAAAPYYSNLDPAGEKVAKGIEQQYLALVTIMGGSTYFASKNVTWTSSVPATGTIDATGKFKAVAVGSTNIAANKGAISSGPVAVTVTNAIPVSVYCKPASVTLVPGGTAQLRAWVRFSDGSPDNEITTDSSASWVSTAGGVAGFNTPSVPGLITGVATGTAKAYATYPGVPAPAAADQCSITVP